MEQSMKEKKIPGKSDLDTNPLPQAHRPVWTEPKASWLPEGSSVQPGWSLKVTWTRTCSRYVLKQKSHNGAASTLRKYSRRILTKVQKLAECNTDGRNFRFGRDELFLFPDLLLLRVGNLMYLQGCHEGTACDKRFLMCSSGQKDLLLQPCLETPTQALNFAASDP